MKGCEYMEPKDYVLDRIEGEYAYLRDVHTGGEVFIAMALLPEGADVGSKIHSENLQYTLE